MVNKPFMQTPCPNFLFFFNHFDDKKENAETFRLYRLLLGIPSSFTLKNKRQHTACSLFG
ncbi:hypothetical protein SD77_1742 [Bacillus badius]|uniref:Uncharacterized protein n=1 Tax=Bacillus badius TaxID=1455 RepID=A0ABR5AQU8_BACBA|nr:hypothetical protein SD78_4222 [Bacillus badius]KIL77137.1 hypothetical protein SD77_1742 [Bacillus badius]